MGLFKLIIVFICYFVGWAMLHLQLLFPFLSFSKFEIILLCSAPYSAQLYVLFYESIDIIQ